MQHNPEKALVASLHNKCWHWKPEPPPHTHINTHIAAIFAHPAMTLCATHDEDHVSYFQAHYMELLCQAEPLSCLSAQTPCKKQSDLNRSLHPQGNQRKTSHGWYPWLINTQCKIKTVRLAHRISLNVLQQTNIIIGNFT